MKQETIESCTRSLLPIRDTLNILNGKWKLPIMFALMFDDLRFKEMQREIKGITPKMLARELRELEINQLICRRPVNGNAEIFQYTITPYGRTLKKLIVEIEVWGIKHRDRIMSRAVVH